MSKKKQEGWLDKLDNFMSAPARYATQAITGKYQDPSDALGISEKDHPYLKLVTNMALDPTNLLGMGLVSKLGKIAKGIKVIQRGDKVLTEFADGVKLISRAIPKAIESNKAAKKVYEATEKTGKIWKDIPSPIDLEHTLHQAIDLKKTDGVWGVSLINDLIKQKPEQKTIIKNTYNKEINKKPELIKPSQPVKNQLYKKEIKVNKPVYTKQTNNVIDSIKPSVTNTIPKMATMHEGYDAPPEPTIWGPTGKITKSQFLQTHDINAWYKATGTKATQETNPNQYALGGNVFNTTQAQADNTSRRIPNSQMHGGTEDFRFKPGGVFYTPPPVKPVTRPSIKTKLMNSLSLNNIFNSNDYQPIRVPIKQSNTKLPIESLMMQDGVRVTKDQFLQNHDINAWNKATNQPLVVPKKQNGGWLDQL